MAVSLASLEKVVSTIQLSFVALSPTYLKVKAQSYYQCLFIACMHVDFSS